MPTLVRLLTVIALIAAVIYAIMAALVFFVEPTPRRITIDVPLRELGTVPPAGNVAPVAGDAAPAAGDAAPAPVAGGAASAAGEPEQ